MRNLMIGIFIGFKIHRIVVGITYIKENPEDPGVIKMKEAFNTVKTSVKKHWAEAQKTAATNAEFQNIVDKIDLNSDEKKQD